MNQTAASRSIRARFAAAARTYHDESALQRKVAERLAASLLPAGQIDCLLEIGCGTGVLTELLRLRFPDAVIHAVDIARPMIEQARDRLGEYRMRWHVADVGQFRPERDFPLIISSSALHWMTPVHEIIRRLAGMLEPGGALISALMVKGTFGELHDAREYLFPEKTAEAYLPPAEKVLEAISDVGLKIDDISRLEVFREHYVSASGLFRSLNRQGVTGVANSGGRLLNPGELRKLTSYYDERFAAPGGGVFATYHVLYVKANREK